MQLKKLFLILLPLFFFFAAGSISAASTCNQSYGAWCAPGNESDQTCCDQPELGWGCWVGGTNGAEAKIGSCTYRCLEGVIRPLFCDDNAYGLQASCGFQPDVKKHWGNYEYYCENGIWLPSVGINGAIGNRVCENAPLGQDTFRCLPDGTCSYDASYSFIPHCEYFCFNGQATRVYNQYGSNEIDCPISCENGTGTPGKCACKLEGSKYFDKSFTDHGTKALNQRCDQICPHIDGQRAWGCHNVCNNGTWSLDNPDLCQYTSLTEVASCNETCTDDVWGCACPDNCLQTEVDGGATCNDVTYDSCVDGNGNTRDHGENWTEGGCVRECIDGTVTPSECPIPGEQCWRAQRVVSTYPNLVILPGGYEDDGSTNITLGEANCQSLCTGSDFDSWSCVADCDNGTWVNVNSCEFQETTSLADCDAACDNVFGCTCPLECNESTVTMNYTCGGLAPLSCGEHEDNTIWTEDFCNHRCDNGVETIIESSCAYPNGRICDPSRPEQCISGYCEYDSRIDIYTCENEPLPNQACSVGQSTLEDGESTWFSGVCWEYCTDSTNEPAQSCYIRCENGNASIDPSGGCVYPPTELDSCSDTCTANAGCVCPSTCNTSGEITKNQTCGGSVPQDCGFLAHGETGKTSSSNCYNGGCTVNTNGPAPSSCSVTCDDGVYTNASACVYPKKSLGSCDATCDATFGCSCPSTCTNDEISNRQSCGGIPYQSCTIDGYADLEHGDTKHYFSYIDILGLHDPCASYCTNQTNLPAVGCNLSCDDGDLNLVSNSCEYPRTPLDTCTRICTADAGCVCPDNCVKEGNIAKYAACGGSVPQDCGFLAHGETGKTSSSNCYNGGCTVNTNGPAPSSCSVTCDDGVYTNASACVYPKKSLGSCDATCDATFGCSCPNICTNDEISLNQSCGGLLVQSCSIEGFSDLEHGETKLYFNYTDALGDHTPCANFCTNSTNLPAEECYLTCTDGQLSLRENSDSACTYPQTPLTGCAQPCTADAGCTCPEGCIKTGDIGKDDVCGDPIPICSSTLSARCSVDGNYSEYCAIPGIRPVSRTYCSYGCDSTTNKCNLAPNGTACTQSSECASDICYNGICTNAIGGTEPTPDLFCPDYNDNEEYCSQVAGCEYKTQTNKCVPSGSPTYCDIESPGVCGGTLYDCTALHGFEDTCNAISGCTYKADEGLCLNEPKTAVGTWCPTPNNEPAVCLPNPDLAGSQYSNVCACLDKYGDDVLKPYGIPCDKNSECYSNYCAPQSPTRPEYKTCIDRPVPEPIPVPIATDESCHPSSAYLCESRICEPKEEQDFSCVTACTIQILTTEELNACLDDCNVTSYVCAEKPPKSAGQICRADEECESLICSGNEVTPGVCEPIVECTTHERCREYFGGDNYACSVGQRMCTRTQTPDTPPATSDVFCPELSYSECEEQEVCEYKVFESTPNPGGLIDPIPGAGVCVNKDWPEACDNIYSSSACRYEDSMVDHGKYVGDTCNLTSTESAYCIPSEREEDGEIAYYNVCYCSNTSGIENYQVFAKQFCPSNAKDGCQCLHDNLNLGHVSNIAPGEYCSPTIDKNVLCSQTEHGESCWCPSLEGHGILVPIETNLIQAGEVCGECNPDVVLSCLDEAIADGDLTKIFQEIGAAFMLGFNRSEAGQEFANNIVNHMFDDSRPPLERIAIAVEDGMNLAVNLLTFWGVETTFDLTTQMQACLDTNRDQILGGVPESDSVIATMSSAFEQTISLCGGQIVSTYISGVATSINIGQISRGILNSFNGARLAEQIVKKIEPRLLRISWVADIVDNAPYIKPNELLRLADEAGISLSDAFTFANTKNLINSRIIEYQFGDSVSILIDDVIRYSVQNLEKISYETLGNMASAGVKLSLEQFETVVENRLLLTTIDVADNELAIRYKYYNELKNRNLLNPEIEYYFQGGGGEWTIIDHLVAALGNKYNDDLIVDGVNIVGDTAYNFTERYNDFAMADLTSKVRQYPDFTNQDYLDTIKLYFEHPELNIKIQKIIVDESTDTIIGLQMERRGISLFDYIQTHTVKIPDSTVNEFLRDYDYWVNSGVPTNRNVRPKNIIIELEGDQPVAIWLDDYDTSPTQNALDEYITDVANLKNNIEAGNFAVTHDGITPNNFDFRNIALILEYAIKNGELTEFEMNRMRSVGVILSPDDFVTIVDNQLIENSSDPLIARSTLKSHGLLSARRFYLVDEAVLNIEQRSSIRLGNELGSGSFGVVYEDQSNPDIVRKILDKSMTIHEFDYAYYRYDSNGFWAMFDRVNDPTADKVVNSLQLGYYLRIAESGVDVDNILQITGIIVEDQNIVGWTMTKLDDYSSLYAAASAIAATQPPAQFETFMNRIYSAIDLYQRQTGAAYGVARKRGGDIIHSYVAVDTGAPTFNYGNIMIKKLRNQQGQVVGFDLNDIKIVDQFDADVFDFTNFNALITNVDQELEAARAATDDMINRGNVAIQVPR